MTEIQNQNTPLIETRSIKKHFPVRQSLLTKLVTREKESVVHAVNGVDVQIWPGETLGLVGESGSGKTTFGKVLARLYQPTSGEILFQGKPLDNGKVLLNGQNGSDSPRRVPYYRITQVIFQNPYSSLNPRKTVSEMISTALYHRGIKNPADQYQQTVQLLDSVGLSARHAGAYPHQFSGGQRQRISIARALAMDPLFIIADEPVSSLDVSVQAQVINLLEKLQTELGLTYLFIAHDLSVVYYISSRVAVMYLGKIVETGKTEDLYYSPLHPYTRALLAAIPRVNEANRQERILLTGDVPNPIQIPQGCPFQTRCFDRVGSICEHEMPPVFLVDRQQVACWKYQSYAVLEKK